MRLGKLFAIDSIAGVRQLQLQLKKMANDNRTVSRETKSDGERFQIEGQADAYDFVADQLTNMLYGERCFGEK